ncbi:MAG: CcmD family protein [Desulfovibrio sp.]|nr:CcmD family protein [Desulfovibrio sp.]
MEPFSWLLAANVIVWLGLGGYTLFLSRKQQKLFQRLQQLEHTRRSPSSLSDNS